MTSTRIHNTGGAIIDTSWDFKGEKTKQYTHVFHTYPAMFIPQIAHRLLQEYSDKKNTICDIFCGSGTALVESRLLGRNAYGIELNPLAVFIAKTKTIAINPKLLQKKYSLILKEINKSKIKDSELPTFPNIEFWFKKSAMQDLAKIKKSIHKVCKGKVKNFFLVAFSETARLASNMRRGEFKLYRISKEKLDDYQPNTLSIFKECCEKNILGMFSYYKGVNRNTWVNILHADSTKKYNIDDNSIDCIITSPPYGDSRTTVAYGQFSRLSSQWLGLINKDNVDKMLLGGIVGKNIDRMPDSPSLRAVIHKIDLHDTKRSEEVKEFYIDLYNAMLQAKRILKTNKYFCLVVGNRTVKKIKLPTDLIVSELGQKLGFKVENIIRRNIPNKRMPLKNSPTNVKGDTVATMTTESIVILKK